MRCRWAGAAVPSPSAEAGRVQWALVEVGRTAGRRPPGARRAAGGEALDTGPGRGGAAVPAASAGCGDPAQRQRQVVERPAGGGLQQGPRRSGPERGGGGVPRPSAGSGSCGVQPVSQRAGTPSGAAEAGKSDVGARTGRAPRPLPPRRPGDPSRRCLPGGLRSARGQRCHGGRGLGRPAAGGREGGRRREKRGGRGGPGGGGGERERDRDRREGASEQGRQAGREGGTALGRRRRRVQRTSRDAAPRYQGAQPGRPDPTGHTVMSAATGGPGGRPGGGRGGGEAGRGARR